MTAGAGGVLISGCTDQGVVVTARTVGGADRDQGGMIEGRGMLGLPGPAVAGSAVAGNQPGLQGRYRRMTEGAVVQMRHAHRRIGARRIMAGRAGRRT